MSRFSRIKIEGFRRLRNVDLGLTSLNVLIGPNGAGKSTFLETFKLLAASASGRLSAELARMRGLNEQLSAVSGSKELRIELDMDRDANPVPMYYSLALTPMGLAYRVLDERLAEYRDPSKPAFLHITSDEGRVRYFSPDQKKLIPPTWEHDHSETSLYQVPKIFPDADEFRKKLASCELYHHLDIGPQASIRLPQAMQPAALPGANGEYLLSCLYALRESDPVRFEALEDTVRTAFPGFVRFGFPAVAAGTIAMTWQELHLDKPSFTHQLSEGTLRFLWLATLLQSKSLPTITLIDEPEISLHPRLLGLLADLMREASKRTQLFVATHSEQLVRHLHADEVIVTTLGRDGLAEMRRVNSLHLERWMQDFSIDELWHMGKLEEVE